MFGVWNISFMILRSHFDSRLAGSGVGCHYSGGVRTKAQGTDKLLAGGEAGRSRVWEAGAQQGDVTGRR